MCTVVSRSFVLTQLVNTYLKHIAVRKKMNKPRPTDANQVVNTQLLILQKDLTPEDDPVSHDCNLSMSAVAAEIFVESRIRGHHLSIHDPY